MLKYKRILLKLSGEALSGDKHFGIDPDTLDSFCRAIKETSDLGAEIGISTQKLHVRGPMAAEAMTTIKYYVDGDGQVR